ncbi:MAG: hypothetical protein GXP32_00625 [Kiritimatiellaeota bacterium]|nr:hypothetical protein [Kiritimatiellota bacterium]
MPTGKKWMRGTRLEMNTPEAFQNTSGTLNLKNHSSSLEYSDSPFDF